MTSPDKSGLSEDIGVIEIYGSQASSFTRTIELGLHELSIPFIQVGRQPHSEDIKSRNPFGLLPVLAHRPDGLYSESSDIVTVYESNAIRRYIDELLSPIASKSFTQLTPPLANLTHSKISSEDHVKTVIERAKLESLICSISQSAFPAFEHGFIKPATAMQRNGADDASILVALEENVIRVNSILDIFESLAKVNNPTTTSSNEYQGWLNGPKHITWADLYLYPILADLRVTPLGNLIKPGSDCIYPWITAWMNRMDDRQSVKVTFPGTLAAIKEKNTQSH